MSNETQCREDWALMGAVVRLQLWCQAAAASDFGVEGRRGGKLQHAVSCGNRASAQHLGPEALE